MSIAATPKTSNPVRLSGNLSMAFVTLTFGGVYAGGGEDLLGPLEDIPGFNTTKAPLFLFGTTDTGYTCRLESNGKLTLWDGKAEMAGGAYDATTADVTVFIEKY